MAEMELTRPKAAPQGKITFEEFLAWDNEDSQVEWEDGEVIIMSPISLRHQDLASWLEILLRVYVRYHKLGRVIDAPFLVRLQITQQGREPDLFFVKNENMDHLHNTYFEGPPDLMVEVVSPESVSRDRGRKFVEYEKEGVPEYWLLDPIRQQAEFYQRGTDGFYHLSLPDAKGVYHSLSVDGFWLNLAWLWQDPLPDELSILGQLGVLAR